MLAAMRALVLTAAAVTLWDPFFAFARIDRYDDASFLNMIATLVPGALAGNYTFTFAILLVIPFALTFAIRMLYKAFPFLKRRVVQLVLVLAAVNWWTLIISVAVQGELLTDAPDMMHAVAVDALLFTTVALGVATSLKQAAAILLCGPLGVVSDKLSDMKVDLYAAASMAIVILQMPTLYDGFVENNTYSLGDPQFANTFGFQAYILLSGVSLWITCGIPTPADILSLLCLAAFVFLTNYNVALGLLYAAYAQQHFRDGPDGRLPTASSLTTATVHTSPASSGMKVADLERRASAAKR